MSVLKLAGTGEIWGIGDESLALEAVVEVKESALQKVIETHVIDALQTYASKAMAFIPALEKGPPHVHVFSEWDEDEFTCKFNIRELFAEELKGHELPLEPGAYHDCAESRYAKAMLAAHDAWAAAEAARTTDG